MTFSDFRASRAPVSKRIEKPAELKTALAAEKVEIPLKMKVKKPVKPAESVLDKAISSPEQTAPPASKVKIQEPLKPADSVLDEAFFKLEELEKQKAELESKAAIEVDSETALTPAPPIEAEKAEAPVEFKSIAAPPVEVEKVEAPVAVKPLAKSVEPEKVSACGKAGKRTRAKRNWRKRS